ncbi:hypothetical protein FB45DRAFT_1064740 [Roridomyces roridus]|uniref:Uncharacterized protein n=1 Tax=Roridomyces roridus TaxID=1738132 RepID=A0AAD7B9V3_9AGAR|nr:hypothetical protein FB45DRAFT_1064740 [Roridomyces roridus]
MNRPRVHQIHARSLTVDTQDSSSGETLLGKLRAPAGTQYSCRRSYVTLYLHVALVAIQLVLLVVWHQQWEHRIVFSVDQELRVARLVKGIFTTFITLYSALLVFLTQSLALHRDLHRRQLLTATHDNALAWSGLGSAVVRLWQQRAIPASSMGVLSALTYLAGISVLHTAFPGVAAPESLVVNQSMSISTQSLPAFNLSGLDEDNRQNFLNAAGQYAEASLAFFPFLTPGNSLGLHEATLYDVLEPNTGTGSVRVNATGFNISCGYLPHTAFNSNSQTVDVGGTEYWLGAVDRNIITTITRIATSPHSFAPITKFPSAAIFYTSIPVLDSNNSTAPWFKPIDFPAVQIFRCSLTLVEQTVLVDSQSRNFTSFAFDMPQKKQTSRWLPFSGQLDDLSSAAFADGTRGFLDIWEAWYRAMPMSLTIIPPLLEGGLDALVSFSAADIALQQQLELYPFNSTVRNGVYLHEVENQLAKIVASMFWTLGHVPAPSGYMNSSQPLNVSLLTGQAIVSEPVIQDRLALNIFSIVECLVVSLILLGLSFRFRRLGHRDVGATKIDGLDVLQVIWLCRDHPELAANLEQVRVPTDLNLRRAGMLQVQLIDGTAPMREMLEESGEVLQDSDKLLESTYPDRPSRNQVADRPSEREQLCSRWTSDLVLSLVSIILHSALVVIHLILALLCSMGLEHRITFSLSQQSFAAWLLSTFATAFITIYTAGLVFLTQTLSIRRSLRGMQLLTVTHDTVTAWRGIGSALMSVLHPTPSLSPVIPVLLYLTGILALHITSPALLTVQTFNSTIPAPVTTQGIPAFAFSGYELSSSEARMVSVHSPLVYAQGALSYLPFINSSLPHLGLEGGMLYGGLNNSDSGSGTATVDAVQFNMTCGYFADAVVNSTAWTITILGREYSLPYIGATDFGIISTLTYSVLNNDTANLQFQGGMYMGSALFFSTVPIHDSAGNTGPLVNFSNAPRGGDAKTQIFGCSLGLVNRSVTVDSQSRLSLNKWASQKDSSVWLPFQETGSKTESTDPYTALTNDWDSWYIAMPASTSPQYGDAPDWEITVADLFFIDRLNLNSTGASVTLHQFEDALAEFVASMYWTLGHIPPLPGFAPANWDPDGPPPVEVSLLQGTAVFLADTFEARVDANMSFIILGTMVSAVLLLLSLQYLAFRNPTQDKEIISGMGPLHIIWLYRNHPELEAELEQVMDPTTSNLRKAGMVGTRLAGRSVGHFIK